MADKIVAANRELIEAEKASKKNKKASGAAASVAEAAVGANDAASEKSVGAALGAREAISSINNLGSTLASSAGNVISSAIGSLVTVIPSVGGIAAKITKTVKRETDRIDSHVQQISKMMPKVGGANKKKRRTDTKIKKTTKRINHLLTRFKSRRKKIT